MNAKLAQRYLNDGMAVTPRPQLVVRLYERLLSDLQSANRSAVDGLIESTHQALVHAQDIVFELNLALDPESFDGAKSLKSLYDHLERRLVDANLEKSPSIIAECIAVVAPLVETWQEVLTITQTQAAAANPVPDTASGASGSAGEPAPGSQPMRLNATYSI